MSQYPILRTGCQREGDSSCSEDEEELDAERKVKTPEEREQERLQRMEYESRLCNLWVSLERLRERRHWLPYDKDPDDCEDPERMVSFEPIAPFVMRLPLEGCTEEAGAVHCYIAMQFLKFLGADVSVVGEAYFEELNIWDYNSNPLEDLQLETFHPLFSSAVPDIASDYCKLSHLVSEDGPSLVSLNNESYFQFVCNVIYSCVGQMSSKFSSYLATILIQILIDRFRNRPQNCDSTKIEKKYKRIAKKLLSNAKLRNSLLLYRQYGLLEETFGNFAEAEKVYLSALVLGTSKGDIFQSSPAIFQEISVLVFTFIKMHLKAGTCFSGTDSSLHTTSIMSIISCLCNEGKISSAELPSVQPSNILRAKAKISEMLKLAQGSSPSFSNNRMVKMLCCFLALLQAFSSGTKAFCLVYEEAISKAKDFEPSVLRDRLVSNLHEDYLFYSSLLAPLTKGPGMSLSDRKVLVEQGLSMAPNSLPLVVFMAQSQVRT